MENIELDLTKHNIITTKNNLESLIECYRQHDNFILISSDTSSYYVYSIIKEYLDQGLSVNCIVEIDVFRSLKIFQRFDLSVVQESLIKIPFNKRNFTLAQQILEKSFELFLEQNYNYKVPYIPFQLSPSALRIAKKIIENNYINQNFFNKFSKKLIIKLKEYKISYIPEFLGSYIGKTEDRKKDKKKELTINFSTIYNELLKLQKSKEDDLEDVINRLEQDYIVDLKNFYLEWDLDNDEERPFLISDTIKILFGFLFNKDDEYHPLIKGILPKHLSNNVVLIIFDNLGYFDLIRGIKQSKLWSTLNSENEILICPAFSSFITSTGSALSYLIREDKENKSLIDKIVDQMIEEDDPISVITSSQWNQNHPFNKKLFDSKRSGYLRISETVFTLNTLKPYLKELENNHYLVVHSCMGIPHENVSFEKLYEEVEQNVIKRISEAIDLFPDSVIIAIGDHGVQWTHQKIGGGEKLDNNKRISNIPIKDYSMGEVNIDKHKILQLLQLESQNFFPLKPSYVIELPNTKMCHGGFSFSELVIPLIICKPIKKKIDLELEEDQVALGVPSLEESKVKKEDFIPIQKVRDIILHYLETNGPSQVSEITEYVSNAKNKDFSEGDINGLLRSLLRYGNVVKGNPSEGSGKRAKAIIWHLPKHEEKYRKMVDEAEEKILKFIREKKACLFKPIYEELPLKRGITLSILQRLNFQKKIEIKEFERIFYIHNNLIYSKAKIYYIPGNEEYAIKRISEVQSGSSAQRSEKALLSRFDNLIEQLNKELEFEVPEIIKSEAIKIAFRKIKKSGRTGIKHVDLLGAVLSLSFRKFHIPISFDSISKAAVHTSLLLKSKDPKEINNIYKLYSIRKKNIRKLSTEIRRLLALKIKPLSFKDYFKFIIMRLDCPYYIYHFGNQILKESNSFVLPGIDPGGFAGAIIYYIIRKIKPLGICYKTYNQKTIARIINVTEVTLRKAFKILELKIHPYFSSEINEIERFIEDSVDFKELRIITQEGNVSLSEHQNSIEVIIRSLIKNTLDYELTYCEEHYSNGNINHKSVVFFLENEIIEGLLNENYNIILSSQEFIKYLIPGQSRVFVCKNTVDRNLQFSFTPKVVLINIPLSYAKNLIQFAGIELAEFYIQCKDSEFIHAMILDNDSIEEHSIALFDLLEKLELKEYQKSLLIPEIEGQFLNEYIIEFEETLDDDSTSEKEVKTIKKTELFREWLEEEIDVNKDTKKNDQISTQDIVKPKLKDLIDDFKLFIDNIDYSEILKTPKNCYFIINQSLEAYNTNLYQPAFETMLTSLERLLYNYHFIFLKTTERLDIHKYLKDLWKERLISKDLRDQINIIARCRNEVKHGRRDVDLNYFNTYFLLILDSIKRLSYEYFQIPAIHKVIEQLNNLEFVKEHNLIPIKHDPQILKKWLFNKIEQMFIYERDETINNINTFNIIIEFFIASLKDKKQKQFYFSLECEMKREGKNYLIIKMEEMD